MLDYLRGKTAEESRSISDVFHEALGLLASEDAEDVADFDARIGEPNIGHDEFVQSLKADGIILNRLQAAAWVRPEGDTAARSADYLGRYQQPKRQSLSAAIEEINRPRGLAATVVQLSRDMHVEFRRDNAFRCEGRASKKYQQKFFYKTKPISC